MALSGYVTRPSTGQRVHWQAAYPINSDFNEAKARGIPCLGVIGNASHLKKTGQHTPWSTGYAYGWVHAIDLDVTPLQWQKILSSLRSGRWQGVVRFVNYGGSQYHARDKFQRSGSSSDHHLHISYDTGQHKYAGPGLLAYALTADIKGDDDELLSAEAQAFIKKTVDEAVYAGVKQARWGTVDPQSGVFGDPSMQTIREKQEAILTDLEALKAQRFEVPQAAITEAVREALKTLTMKAV